MDIGTKTGEKINDIITLHNEITNNIYKKN